MFETKFATLSDMESSWRLKIANQLKLPCDNHRKWWEIPVVYQTLRTADMLRSGRSGVGFGCGSERLPSHLAELGCQILATDLCDEGWASTHIDFVKFNQHERIQIRNVDMNWLNGSTNREGIAEESYDFAWSVCSMDHCGSIWLTKRFLLNSLNCVKVGGISVHTGEYGLSPNMPREGATVYLTWKDILDLQRLCELLGYDFAPINWDLGNSLEDNQVDSHPYQGPSHLKMDIGGGRVATCVVFAVKKINPGVFWVPLEECEARCQIYERNL